MEQTENEKTPDFNIKSDGEFVGSGWLNQGQFGPYITIRMDGQEKPYYIYPRKGKEGLLGGAVPEQR